MKILTFMQRRCVGLLFRRWVVGALIMLLARGVLAGDRIRIPFEVVLSGYNFVTFKIKNQSDAPIEKVNVTIGNTGYNYDIDDSTEPSGVDYNHGSGRHNDVTVTPDDPFGTLQTLTFTLDIDKDSEDSSQNYKTVLMPNARVTVYDENGDYDFLTLSSSSTSTFLSPNRPPRITVDSESEDGIGLPNTRVHVIRIDGTSEEYKDFETVDITSYLGDVFEISAPRLVYWDRSRSFMGDSTGTITNMHEAAERFEATGISVNNVPHTGDPTSYRFTVDEVVREAKVVVRWRHDYALWIDSDFTETASDLKKATGEPWMPAPTSKALGNPEPSVTLHWVPKGDQVTATIDGQVVDYTYPGLDVRFVPTGYRATGSAAGNGATNYFDGGLVPVVRQSPPSRQKVTPFTMNAPTGIEYLWQIQYGARVNVDDLSRSQLPVVHDVDRDEFHIGEGVFWFHPGTHVRVMCPVNETDTGGDALGGWVNGDGFYFKSLGEIHTPNGSLNKGSPDQCDWTTNLILVITNTQTSTSFTNTYHGMDVFIDYAGVKRPGIQRPVRVMWSYGNPAIAVNAQIGEYVLQKAVTNNHGVFDGATFLTAPEYIKQINVSGRNTQVGESDMAIWDDEAAKLYPLVPGMFRAVWSNEVNGEIDVLVTAVYPQVPHYPHIADTPPVNVDPDATDSFVFKEVKYTENEATVDGDNYFRTEVPGWSVLLFGELMLQGRGQRREFLRVRTVQTWNWQETLSTNAAAVIGRAISDDDLDKAELGTGYVLFDKARYNGQVYDAEKLAGLAVQDVYDMKALQSTEQTLRVIQPGNLPGPVIPVNLHPGALAEERIVVVWYEDPTRHDNLLWPYATRTYLPYWPENSEEGLGRIVIASQFGSESLGPNKLEQVVVGAVTNLTADSDGNTVTNVHAEEMTYNPSRLQQVQIYNQPSLDAAGYNPNEEHALIAPSLKHAAVSPRPPAVYALRNNDLNRNKESKPYTENGQPDGYTSDPYVLVQFFDTADQTFKMRVYEVVAEDANYGFANPRASNLRTQPHVVMAAGEPVIPFYPLGDVWGAVVPPETFGDNITSQLTYWEDHKGTSWAVSGGINAWFTQSPYYPLQPDFWWPDNEPGMIEDNRAAAPAVGNSLAFLPDSTQFAALRSTPLGSPVTGVVKEGNKPTQILYKSEWPDVAPILKAGETLTFSGGEYRADYPTSLRINEDGELETVETPGLPAVLGFAAAEVVYDSLNPTGSGSMVKTHWTARVAQVLEKRSVDLSKNDFPSALTPASGRTRISQSKYVFNELPASLQKRVRYDPVGGKLEVFGLVNDKDIGDDTLTASPPQVYVLEPNILTATDLEELRKLDGSDGWRNAVTALYELTRNPNALEDSGNEVITREYLVGLEQEIVRNPDTGLPVYVDANAVPLVIKRDSTKAAALRALGPGLALLPNADFLDPSADVPDVSWVTLVENNDPSLGGSPITPHIIKVDRRERYRGAIQTVLSDNVFDENVTLRHQGDFGANADALYFEWWYRPDDGSLNVPPPDDSLFETRPNPWKLFPDLTGEQGKARYEVMLKGNPNAPEALLADTWWFCRYRHKNDMVDGIDWAVTQPDGRDEVNFTWAGAGNSDPLGVYNFGIPNYKAQLVMGWIKRVLDAVNPYEARIRDFEGDSPSTVISMLAQFGARFEGPVALNPDKNVIENVGLIELYETILKRGRDLSIDLSRPVSTPAIANALQLAATRISDFYMLLANEAYTDAMDPTIGVDDGSLTPAVGVNDGSPIPAFFAFQNQVSSLIEEELCLLRGVYDNFARPVYNRLFWNFTKGEGEAVYAVNYNVSDVNADGFIDEDDAMLMYPQGHGDAWGHYLTALRNQYDLLNHKYFNWVSRSEFYNLMDVVMKVDFLDERKFAQMAAAKAKAGAELVDLTYREKYVEDPEAQWQGYTDSDELRGWGVQGWARRAGQGAYFDWITANALLPSEHPNAELEGIQKVDRKANSDIAVISANLNAVQRTFDHANDGYNPLGLSKDVVVFDIDPTFIEVGSGMQGVMHFDQLHARAEAALENVAAIWEEANEVANRLREVGTTEAEFRNDVFQEDLAYRNQLIEIFGKPYEGTIGSGKLYPAGYDGPDLALHMYLDIREINNSTVPGPAASFATFGTNGVLNGGAMKGQLDWVTPSLHVLNLLDWDVNYLGTPHAMHLDIASSWRGLYAPTFAGDFAAADGGGVAAKVQNGLYSVAYTDLVTPKVPLAGLTNLMPVTTAGYSFQAPANWGSRKSTGQLQALLSDMLVQEGAVAEAIGDWDSLSGEIVRTLRLINAKWVSADALQVKNETFGRVSSHLRTVLNTIDGIWDLIEGAKETATTVIDASADALPDPLPTGGVAVSPGDALSPAKAGFKFTGIAVTEGMGAAQAIFKGVKLGIESLLEAAEAELNLWEQREELTLNKKEWLTEIENLVGDEPIKRIAVFKEIETLRSMSEQYRTLLDQGAQLIDERTAFNKRVAADVQRNRYQDMTFRVSRNHALRNYRAAVDLAARYVYLAAKAYDYETNFADTDPGSPKEVMANVVRARGLDLSLSLAWLKTNYDSIAPQLGINNAQSEMGKASLRTEWKRILPKGETQPEGVDGFPSPGGNSDDLWRQTLLEAQVDDLWGVPEFRKYCRAFASESNADEHTPQPGLVFRFPTTITAGQNFFGKPLSGGDHAYDPTVYSTKIRAAGVWFSDYLSDDVLTDLPAAPRVYLFPAGIDRMRVSTAVDADEVRDWKVVDQRIPVPIPAVSSELDSSEWSPLTSSLNGRFGEARRYSSFRAYHNGGDEVIEDELVFNSRLVGRSVWNTEWVLIVPGITFNADPKVGLERFIEQVSDISLVFETYGYSGN